MNLKTNIPTLSEALADFLIACRADGLSNATIVWYESILKTMLSWIGDVPLANVTTQQLRLYIIYMRETYPVYDTQHAHIRANHRFWRWCSIEYTIENPMRNIKFPRQPKQLQPKSASENDVLRMFEMLEDTPIGRRDGAILAMLYDTGCRATGICSMQVSELDMVNKQVLTHEKGRKTRQVSFSQFTADFLRSWLDVRSQGVKPLFYNLRTFKPLTRSGLEQMLKRMKARAGVKGRVNPHSFRHAFARQFILNGGDLATLSKILGHESIETTALYYAVFTQSELGDKQKKHSPMNELSKRLDKGGRGG